MVVELVSDDFHVGQGTWAGLAVNGPVVAGQRGGGIISYLRV